MGGVRTDLQGKTNVPGLYAAGEAAATGVHGANRLASNSLVEGFVYGARAGKAMRNELRRTSPAANTAEETVTESDTKSENSDDLVREIRDVMWKDVGIVRTGKGLQRAIACLLELDFRCDRPLSRRAHQARNLYQVGLLIARSALAREESRGAHYRTDFPAHDDAGFKKHSVARGDSIWFE
jgi:L-aspartate oxidase